MVPALIACNLANNFYVNGAPGEIIRAARSPLRGRPSGDRHRRYAAQSSNSLVVRREFELKHQTTRTDGLFSNRKIMVRPERFALQTKYLFYIDKYFINLLHIACTDM